MPHDPTNLRECSGQQKYRQPELSKPNTPHSFTMTTNNNESNPPEQLAAINIDSSSPPSSSSCWSSKRFWCCMNLMCCVWSILLVLEIVWTIQPLDRLEGTHAYLVWCFGTTIIWCIEVGVKIWVPSASTTASRFATVMLWIEAALAVYFLIDCALLFRQWNRAEDEIEGELIEVSLTAGAG